MSDTKGVDISFAQGQANFDSIVAENQFVIIRAGYGGGGVDPQFARNVSEARNRGIARGFYFYAYPGRSSGRQQAEDFKRIVGDLQAGEFVALDIEDDTTYGRALVASDVAWCKEFLDRCNELFGVKPLIYMNSSVLGRFDWSPVKNADYGLWQANYGSNTGSPGTQPSAGIWPFTAIWQYTSKPIDRNLFLGENVDALKKYGFSGGGQSAPAPQPAPAPTPLPTSSQYTVVSGDTLSGLAAKFGTTVAQLQNDNGISNPNLIRVGQVLTVRKGGTADRTYTVRPGDNLSAIASRYNTTVAAIARSNNISNPNLIFPGQVLNV